MLFAFYIVNILNRELKHFLLDDLQTFITISYNGHVFSYKLTAYAAFCPVPIKLNVDFPFAFQFQYNNSELFKKEAMDRYYGSVRKKSLKKALVRNDDYF